MSPTEVIAALRQLATDMRAIADWLLHNWQIDKDYSRRGQELMTAAIVVGYWADGIEAMINAQVTGGAASSPRPLDCDVLGVFF